jgi:transcriptional regulator with XRE-family HTH domain
MSYMLYSLSVMSPATVLREARLRAGLTQAELARRLGTSQAAVARLERPGANPTFSTLQRAVHETGHRLLVEASERASSVDDTLIASYLRMSPAERLKAFQSSHESLARLKRGGG